MEPDEQGEPPPLGAMSRRDRRLMGDWARVPLSVIGWQFVKQRDGERHTPRRDGQRRRWQVERLRRRLGERSCDGLSVALEQIAW